MKTKIIVAGLGRFYGAGRRLYLQLSRIRPKVEPILVDEVKLSQIAKKNRIDEKIFNPLTRGYGFWQWKPLIIYHYLKEMDRGEIIYIDAGCDIDPVSFTKFIDWFSYSQFKLLLSKTGHNISNYTKPDVLNQLNISGLDPKKIEMLQAGFLCIKTDSNIKKIFEVAYEFVLNGRQDLFNDEISDGSKLPKYFIDHRHDQSVLSLLILNSPHINEVGVLPTDLTPPIHVDRPIFPIIASRNPTCVNLYWPLVKYGSRSDFPEGLRSKLRIMNKLAKVCKYNYLALRIIQNFIDISYSPPKKYFDYQFEDVLILKPPIKIGEPWQ